MPGRWSILSILFLVRGAMAVQFQSVGSVAPLLGRDLDAGLADIGFLIGLYFAPGIALALPGGAIGHRFGDKTTASAGLVLMLAGELSMALLTSWNGQVAGRLVAGTGGVILNVLMTKMVADWFADRELSTAMAIFINSWPVGIAISLLVLPPIGTGYGMSAVHLAIVALSAIAMLLLLALYQTPANLAASTATRPRLAAGSMIAVIAAGVIWALYNIGFAMIFSFGPSMLVERGWSITAAGSTISIVLWLSAISVPVGGVLADRTQHHDVVIVSCCIVYATLLILSSRSDAIIPMIVALGLVCGLAAGPIMRLPALVLPPGVRPLGMGLFYTTFYVSMVLGPALGGKYAAWAHKTGAAFEFGAAAVLLCPVVLWFFHRVARAAAPTPLRQLAV
jgi:MFS family permease